MSSPETAEIAEFAEYPKLLAVIDGMGGYAGGARASLILARALAGASARGTFGDKLDIDADRRAIEGTLSAASAEMSAEAADAPELAGMGATVCGILIRDKTVLVFNCGDCRVYRISGGELERLTREHSVVEALYESGVIDEEGMKSHPQKNIVTSAVCAGAANAANPLKTFEVSIKYVSRCDGDAFFLCSDGVWETLSAETLKLRLASPLLDAAEAAKELWDDLMASRCRDNVSFIWTGK
jgi:protein phosphatase